MRRDLRVWLGILLLSLACGGEAPVGTSVTGITNGTLDGNDHPYVGVLVFRTATGVWARLCSGSLIANDTFLTAAHCTLFLANNGIAVGDYGVSFDTHFTQSSVIVTGASYQMHPDVDFKPSPINDVAVILLQSQVTAVGLAALPPEGILDAMAAKGGLVGARFTDVGYGTLGVSRGSNVVAPALGYRREATAEYRALTRDELVLSENQALDLGGTCYGDSGGPTLFEGTNQVAGVTHGGDINCRSYENFQRLDTPGIRAFLGQFVVLP